MLAAIFILSYELRRSYMHLLTAERDATHKATPKRGLTRYRPLPRPNTPYVTSITLSAAAA
jgi:hypothetical protein